MGIVATTMKNVRSFDSREDDSLFMFLKIRLVSLPSSFAQHHCAFPSFALVVPTQFLLVRSASLTAPNLQTLAKFRSPLKMK